MFALNPLKWFKLSRSLGFNTIKGHDRRNFRGIVAISGHLVIRGQELVLTFFGQFKDVTNDRQIELNRFVEND